MLRRALPCLLLAASAFAVGNLELPNATKTAPIAPSAPSPIIAAALEAAPQEDFQATPEIALPDATAIAPLAVQGDDSNRFEPPAPRFAQTEESLRAFIERTHQDLMRDEPEFFKMKMNKAVESPFTFFRGFPDLLYSRFVRRPDAAAALKTPIITLHGDPHVENIELIKRGGRFIAQFNDFDDSDRAPAALDLARMLVGASLLGDASLASRGELAHAALSAYLDSLKLDFNAWTKSVSSEKSIEKTDNKRKDWERHAGRPLSKEEAAWALAAAGLDAKTWTPYDRRGAGLSSIGVIRYMFVSSEHGHVFELKELRAPALTEAGLPLPKRPDRERVHAAQEILRQIPVNASTLAAGNSDWLFNRRESHEARLDLSHPVSAARVLGGLLAQAHRSQGVSAAELEAAAKAVSLDTVHALASSFIDLRAELKHLLKEGVWK